MPKPWPKTCHICSRYASSLIMDSNCADLSPQEVAVQVKACGAPFVVTVQRSQTHVSSISSQTKFWLLNYIKPGRWTKGNAALWCEGAGNCNQQGEVSVIGGKDITNGAGYSCRYAYMNTGPSPTVWYDAELAYCCPADILLRVSFSAHFGVDGTDSDRALLIFPFHWRKYFCIL